MYSSNGAENGRAGYWHYDPDGSAYYQLEDVYKGMIDGFIDKQFQLGESFTPEDAGFRSSTLKSFGFQQLYASATKKYETAGMYVHNRYNPYFKGDQLYDNNGDLLTIIEGGIGLWKLGVGASRYIGSRLITKTTVEVSIEASRTTVLGAIPGVVATPVGEAAIDANTLIRALEAGQLQDLDVVLAGRKPVVSWRASKEFLRRGNADVLREFIMSRGGRISKEVATVEEIIQLQNEASSLNRVVHEPDAAVAVSAIREDIPLITADRRFFKFLQHRGYRSEFFITR